MVRKLGRKTEFLIEQRAREGSVGEKFRHVAKILQQQYLDIATKSSAVNSKIGFH